MVGTAARRMSSKSRARSVTALAFLPGVPRHDNIGGRRPVCKGASSDDLTTGLFECMALPEIEDDTNFDVPEVFFRPAR